MLVFVSVNCADDYYRLLGVPRNANEKDIKKAYRAKAKKWHVSSMLVVQLNHTNQSISQRMIVNCEKHVCPYYSVA